MENNPNRECQLYNDVVMDRFMNPQNVGDIENADGVGEVGTAACFSGDTMVATADGKLHQPIKNLVGKILPVWSFNLKTNLFEIKNATGVQSGKKKIFRLKLNDGGYIDCTEDHEFLVRPKNQYIENKNIDILTSIRPFKRKIINNGYWEIRRTNHRKEHIEIYLFSNPNYSVSENDIHHVDNNKRNNLIENLNGLSKKDHTKLHAPKWNKPTRYGISISKDKILKNINNFDDKSEMANYFKVYTDHLMYILGHYNIDKRFKKRTSKELKQLFSNNVRGNKNPYHKMTVEWKIKFASKPMEKNPKWMGCSDEILFKNGNILYKKCGRLTKSLWNSYAKKNKLPQCLSTRFKTWNEFKEECVNYNHTIISREYLGEFDTYTLQVEENNNYVVLSRITKNVEEGIVVKNCGDIMRLSLKVKDGIIQDARFKSFGCGTAIASADMACSLIKGKTVEEADKLTNEDIINGLGAIPPVKIHCSVLGEEAIKAALEDYRKRIVKT